jgi:hypothetical protein
MQATTALSLTLPVITCLPILFRFLTTSQYLMHGKSPLTREITRAPSMAAQRCVGAGVPASYARMIGPRTYGLTHGYTSHVVDMEGHIKKG